MNRTTGVYAIKHLDTGKVYIGSAEHIKRRWKKHRYQLSVKAHKNPHLQEDHNKSGKNGFEYLVLEECPRESLIERECYWVDKFDSLNPEKGYNCYKPGDAKVMRESTRKKRRMQPILIKNIKSGEESTYPTISECIATLKLTTVKVNKCLNAEFGRYSHHGYHMKRVTP